MYNLWESIQIWWLSRKRKKLKEETIKKTGWESKCVKCGRLYFTDSCGKFICDSGSHWHYRCEGCGYKSKYLLTIMPVYDGESDAIIRRAPYYDLIEFYVFFGELQVYDKQTESIVCELSQHSVEMGLPVLQIKGDSKVYASYDALHAELIRRFPRPVNQILYLNTKSATGVSNFVRLEKQFQLSCELGSSLQVFAHCDDSIPILSSEDYTQLEFEKYIDIHIHEIPKGCNKLSFLVEV